MNFYRTAALALIFGVTTAGAAPLSPADRDAIAQQQQQLLQQNQQQRQQLERSTVLPHAARSDSTQPQTGPCFPIRHIILSGAHILDASNQSRLLAPWQGQCLNLARIRELTDAVSDWYISRGYITSRAFLTGQDLSSGNLNIVVLEGRLQAIQLNGTDDRLLKMAFPGLEGRILNLRDIEQGMEQINRVRSRPVQIEIVPGSEPGYSIVNLSATPEFPLSASVGFDNSGQKSTGTGQLFGSLVGNNLLGLADRWFISGGRSSDFSNSKDAQNFAAGVSLPWGYGLLDYSYSWNNYLSTIDNNGWPWESTGDSETHRLAGTWVLFRNGDIKTGVMLGLNHRIGRNYLEGVRLDTSSRKLTSLLVGVNHTQKMFGGVATFNPTFSRGVPWLGAENDNHKSGDVPKAEFRKWSLSASFQMPVVGELWWLSSFYGQWSPDRLYGSEQLTIGGESSVRGFKEQYLSGDNGGYWRNELNYPLFTLPVIGQINALVALDGGWLKKDTDQSYASGTLWGSAIGLSSSGRYYSSQFTLGIPVSYPHRLKPDSASVYYRIAFAF